MGSLLRTSYQDIKASVLDRIRSGIWPPGALLPGEIALACEFDCARATVSRAMRELVDEGIVERKRKSGTRVKSSPTRRAEFAIPIIREEILSTGATYRYALMEREVITAPGWLRARMSDIARDAEVLHIRCLHYANSTPYQFEDRWINLAAVPQAAAYDFEDMGPNEWLIREVPFTEGELIFSAVNATAEISDFLNTPENTAIFTAERATWLNQTSVTLARLYFSRDYRMTTRL